MSRKTIENTAHNRSNTSNQRHMSIEHLNNRSQSPSYSNYKTSKYLNSNSEPLQINKQVYDEYLFTFFESGDIKKFILNSKEPSKLSIIRFNYRDYIGYKKCIMSAVMHTGKKKIYTGNVSGYQLEWSVGTGYISKSLGKVFDTPINKMWLSDDERQIYAMSYKETQIKKINIDEKAPMDYPNELNYQNENPNFSVLATVLKGDYLYTFDLFANIKAYNLNYLSLDYEIPRISYDKFVSAAITENSKYMFITDERGLVTQLELMSDNSKDNFKKYCYKKPKESKILTMTCTKDSKFMFCIDMLGILIQIDTKKKLAVKNYGRIFPMINHNSSKVIPDLVHMTVSSDNKFLYVSGNIGMVLKIDIENMVLLENYGKISGCMINEIKVSHDGDSLIVKDAQSRQNKLSVGNQGNKYNMSGDVFNIDRENMSFILFGEKSNNAITQD